MPINFKPSNPGTKTVPKYEGIVQRDGSVRLEPAGVRYLFEEIQADRDAGDINIIVRRYAAGDTTALSAVQGWYGDVTKLPENRQEMLNMMLSAETQFDALPLDLRQAFDNDWRKAFAAMDTPEFEEIVKDYISKEQKSKLIPDPEEQIKE